jgi:hypothetical protein
VNDNKRLDTPDGSFSLDLKTDKPGEYSYTIKAGYGSKEQGIRVISITRMPDVEIVPLPEVVNEPRVVLSGIVNPKYSLFISGQEVDINKTQGEFTINYTLSQGYGYKYEFSILVKDEHEKSVFNKTYIVSCEKK